MSEPIQRFDIPAKPKIIETFRAMRTYFERVAEAKGRKLDPAWYDDGPETLPHLWKDQPEVLKQTPTEREST
jgi:hypothetical protein